MTGKGGVTRHLSASSLTAYLTCPAKFKATRIDRRKEPVTPALATGIATHAAMEWFLTQRIRTRRTGIDSPVTLLAQLNSLERFYDRAFDLEAEKVTDWQRQTPESAMRDGRGAVIAIAANMANEHIDTIEVPFSIPLTDGCTLNGRTDADRTDVVFDFKSQTTNTRSSWYWSPWKAHRETQPGVYGLAHWHRTGIPPKAVVFVVAEKSATPPPAVRYRVPMSPVRLIGTALIARMVSMAVARDMFPRAKACDWCPFAKQGEQGC